MSNMGKDAQHHPKEALEGKQGWQGVPQSCRKSTVNALSLDPQPGEGLKKVFETHYTIT